MLLPRADIPVSLLQTDAAHHLMSQQQIPAQWSLRECVGRSGHDLPSIAENDRREGNSAGDSVVVRTDRRLPCNAAVYDRDAVIELIDWYRCRWEVELITRMVSTFRTDSKEWEREVAVPAWTVAMLGWRW